MCTDDSNNVHTQNAFTQYKLATNQKYIIYTQIQLAIYSAIVHKSYSIHEL